MSNHLEKYIGVYDNLVPIKIISKTLKYFNQVKNSNFEKGLVINDNNKNNPVQSEVRKVDVLRLSRSSKLLTQVYFYNILKKIILTGFGKYRAQHPCADIARILEINILKYNQHGKYDYHTDHCFQAVRTLSAILLLNNDYDGGDLQ